MQQSGAVLVAFRGLRFRDVLQDGMRLLDKDTDFRACISDDYTVVAPRPQA